MRTNFQSARERIMAAKTLEEFARCEQMIVRVYDAGQITLRELSRLDVLIMERKAAFETRTTR